MPSASMATAGKRRSKKSPGNRVAVAELRAQAETLADELLAHISSVPNYPATCAVFA
jgi:hypothetical protein